MTAEVNMVLPGRLLPRMHLLLAQGVQREAAAGISVRQFLLETLPVEQGYVDDRIQTVFRDGRAVDDLAAERISHPGVIALSAAMPGVFGAAFRKGGRYGRMRGAYRQDDGASGTGSGRRTVGVTLKCFNQVAADLGDDLLAEGVCLDSEDFLRFWRQRETMLAAEIRSLCVNGTEIPPDRLADTLAGRGGNLRLHVRRASAA
ncbi:MAG: hypothetical protein ACLFPD_09235 [Desulfosudaceae bacterium]